LPYGDKGFVIFRKGGDGAVFNNPKMARPTNLTTLGLLPGTKPISKRETWRRPMTTLAQK
jgi:hypothetical protein